ncbi:hypothetical protein GLX_01530 [Komagataeibacter medellinensis NBRC 3288]|uniref:Uncharacterized protein n=1 Tax=Komagataeibacter medellinensis (strain NBRC 3288 / BCRC 11682 / LMG 1693 / Kondo 51) TaxID=634177 RepID=G2I2E9_KOMMN|nr:hypothetical protein GLX_01530 [Komagataeibacter medellinensis NBRC 3288]
MQDYPSREAKAETRVLLSRHALQSDRRDLFHKTEILWHINVKLPELRCAPLRPGWMLSVVHGAVSMP